MKNALGYAASVVYSVDTQPPVWHFPTDTTIWAVQLFALSLILSIIPMAEKPAFAPGESKHTFNWSALGPQALCLSRQLPMFVRG